MCVFPFINDMSLDSRPFSFFFGQQPQEQTNGMRRDQRGLAAALFSLLLLIALTGVCKSAPLPEETPSAKLKHPGITYAAGPNQLTLIIGDKGAVRFGYETDNQFRAERRFPNGTVVGYYGYIGADGVPIRVSYGAVGDLGFNAMQEIIPDKFPPETSTPPTEEVEEGEGRLMLMKSADEPADLPDGKVFVDEERNSISVESADEIIQPRRKFVFPKIELDEFSRGRHLRSLPEAMPIPAPVTAEDEENHLVMEQQPGESAIIYSEPRRSPLIKTLRVNYSVQ